MYVRWKRHQRIQWKRRCTFERIDGQLWQDTHYERIPTGVWTRKAVLVQSVRTAAGPRQRFVAHLAAIQEGHERSPSRRAAFWDSVDYRLRAVPLSDAERAAIITKLEADIPRPPARP